MELNVIFLGNPDVFRYICCIEHIVPDSHVSHVSDALIVSCACCLYM